MRFALLLAPLTIVASIAAAPASKHAAAISEQPKADASKPKTKPVKGNHLLWFPHKYTNTKHEVLYGDQAAKEAWTEWCLLWLGIDVPNENVFVQKWPTPKNWPIYLVHCWLPVPGGGEPLDVTIDLGSTINARLVNNHLRPYTMLDPSFKNTGGLPH